MTNQPLPIYYHISDIPYYEEAPDYEIFLHQHLLPNVPCLLGSEITKSWRARKEWIQTTMNKTLPNFEYLRDKFGTAEVEVTDCSEKNLTEQPKLRMFFSEFISSWESREREGKFYLKDWHFTKAFPKYESYTTPEIFQDDWLNKFWKSRDDVQDDYRFVYMGSDKTFTPFHVDVYRSYSWSANVCGTKIWTLFPPGQDHLFKDKLGNLIYDVRDQVVIEKNFPDIKQARRLEITQHEGEILFVPSGWYHQVENVGDTISINHNWCNSCTLALLYKALDIDLIEVRHALRHVRESMSQEEFEFTCQRILLLNSGWNWVTFWRLVTSGVERVIRDGLSDIEPSKEYILQQSSIVLSKLLANDFAKMMIIDWYGGNKERIDNISAYLKSSILDDEC